MPPIEVPWARTAYIRTTHISTDGTPDTRRDSLWDFLYSNIHQWTGRHRYIFGVSSAADATILDFTLARTNRASRWFDSRKPGLEAGDLLLYVPENVAETMKGRRLLRMLEKEGVSYVIRGADEQACDDAMLLESDYVLDQFTWTLAVRRTDTWFHQTYRHGKPEICEKKFDYSQVRLSLKQGLYSFAELSGQRRPRGVSYYHCSGCGGKCKRSGPCRATDKTRKVER
ncbi:hypothetical protein BJ170DRAFT_310452 [Xylariales sp. AK1849]|nr:hypothetical protein BJ170DRAFT_310452 [Xylariales sp. AK1849]